MSEGIAISINGHSAAGSKAVLEFLTKNVELFDGVEFEENGDWRSAILVRDSLDAMTAVSYLANLLYPELPMHKDREAQFYKDGGDFANAIAKAAQARLEACQRHELFPGKK